MSCCLCECLCRQHVFWVFFVVFSELFLCYVLVENGTLTQGSCLDLLLLQLWDSSQPEEWHCWATSEFLWFMRSKLSRWIDQGAVNTFFVTDMSGMTYFLTLTPYLVMGVFLRREWKGIKLLFVVLTSMKKRSFSPDNTSCYWTC